jgi:Ras-related GTP-binding protein A/B
MRSIIFANYIARDTRRLGATIDVEHNHVRFLGNLVLNLWDCGGQESFMDNYITSQREQIFRNVEILIYVFDVESQGFEADLLYYKNMIECLAALSKDAKVFCLIHKMDLVVPDKREQVFKEKSKRISEMSSPLDLTLFSTSIWDETLYHAWSSIVYSLIPNVQQLESTLQQFSDICEASEVILFERTTFLVISHTKGSSHSDVHRFEKVSNIIKQFKLSCSKSQAQFQTMEIRNNFLSIFVRPLTPNTFILVVIPDSKIRMILINPESAIPIMNIQAAKPFFEELEKKQNK